jgi:hypothetical protein
MVVLSSCAANLSTQAQLKSDSIIVMDSYGAAYEDVKTTLNNHLSTPSQREIALKKRAILIKIWVILEPYVDIVNNGGVIDAKNIQAINKLLNELTMLATTAIH